MKERLKKISTYKVTDDSTADGESYINTPYLQREYERIHSKVTAPTIQFPKNLEKELLRHIEKSPETATWYNLLTSFYLRTKNTTAARKINIQAQKNHPDYLFAITQAAEFAIADKDFALAERFLGSDLLIEKRFPERKRFHESEFYAYYSSVMIFLVEQERFEEAENCLRTVRKWSEKDSKTKQIAVLLIIKKAKTNAAKRKEKESKITIKEVEGYSLVKYEQTGQRTALLLPQLDIFYHAEPSKITEAKLKELIALPRAELIEDCENILLDTIRRYDEFQNIEFDPDLYSFYCHALNFLGALKAEESIDVIFDCLKQGNEFIDFWYSVHLADFFNHALYQIGQNQLEKLADFVKTPYINGWAKILITDVVKQVGLAQPERRDEAITWLENIFNYILENEHQEGLLDILFTTELIGIFMYLRAKDKMHYIELFSQKGWLDETMFGDLEAIRTEISTEIDPYEIYPQPKDIFEYYNKNHEKRRAKSNNPTFINSMSSDSISNFGFLTSMLMESILSMEEGFDEFDEVEEVPNTPQQIKQLASKIAAPIVQKVGRNEPCPCGSGKKYKKCHGG